MREWLDARIPRVDLTEFAEPDRMRLARSLGVLTRALGEGGTGAAEAVAVVRGELGRGGSPRADDVLRTHLAIALAARSAEVRDVAAGGALVVTGARQAAECRALADEILALSPHPGLSGFAAELHRRLDRAERWRWVEPDVGTAAVVGLAVLVLPFVGGAIGNAAVAVGGVVVGGALVFGFVMAHRKRQWAVDAEEVR
ncbi:hypothetical protein ACFXGA_09450 [Actinosynnema sp. NPDC059335]|uniref:hypothetical protein n=1 Tax=Actinosynnema sp. NPDC059335 TaxID=3346804 RepID=UPI003672A815